MAVHCPRLKYLGYATPPPPCASARAVCARKARARGCPEVAVFPARVVNGAAAAPALPPPVSARAWAHAANSPPCGVLRPLLNGCVRCCRFCSGLR